jgi:hypothetical protein
MPAAISAHNLTGGPGTVNLTLILAGSPAVLTMNSARMHASIATATNVPAPPPSALAAGLSVFETVAGNGAGQGLCGNITVQSLAQIPIPQALTTGAGACGNCAGSHAYTYCGAGMPVSASCNSLLDVIVGGCKVVACFATAVNATQPDVPGGATVRALTLGAGNKVPTSQITGNVDAYSSYLTFTANRAHATGETCTVTADCQTGLTCTSNVCR